MADEILFALKNGIATITMNRPEKRNALNTILLEGFNSILSHVEESKEARVVVIRGEGKAFCSGIDLRELSSRQTAGADPETGVVQIFQRIERSRIPTIAMVHGDALAGGCELALHCDLRVAAEPARIGMPLARLGLIVPFPLGQKLVEIIGPAFTKQILFTGQPITATRAYEIGMIHYLVSPSDLESTTYALARTSADNAPLSLVGMKATILRSISL